jgi:hypothetical protein
MKYLILVITLIFSSSLFAAGKITNHSVKSLAEVTAAGGSASDLINDTKIYITGGSLNKQLSAAITAQDFVKNLTSLSFLSNTDKVTTIQGSASATASVTYSLPVADGSNGQALVTNGSGTLSWGSSSGGLFVGSLDYATTAGCLPTYTGTGSFGNFAEDTDCPTPTLAGNALAPSTKIPGIKFASLPAGRYVITFEGVVGSGSQMTLRFSDGSNTSSENYWQATGVSANYVGYFSVSLDYSTTQTNVTLQMQANSPSGGSTVSVYATNLPMRISVYYYPTM